MRTRVRVQMYMVACVRVSSLMKYMSIVYASVNVYERMRV